MVVIRTKHLLGKSLLSLECLICCSCFRQIATSFLELSLELLQYLMPFGISHSYGGYWLSSIVEHLSDSIPAIHTKELLYMASPHNPNWCCWQHNYYILYVKEPCLDVSLFATVATTNTTLALVHGKDRYGLMYSLNVVNGQKVGSEDCWGHTNKSTILCLKDALSHWNVEWPLQIYKQYHTALTTPKCTLPFHYTTHTMTQLMSRATPPKHNHPPWQPVILPNRTVHVISVLPH